MYACVYIHLYVYIYIYIYTQNMRCIAYVSALRMACADNACHPSRVREGHRAPRTEGGVCDLIC